MLPTKAYVCQACGQEHVALPFGGWCDACRLGGTIRVAIVCSNCGQWRWAHRVEGADQPIYRCLNDCAAKGLV